MSVLLRLILLYFYFLTDRLLLVMEYFYTVVWALFLKVKYLCTSSTTSNIKEETRMGLIDFHRAGVYQVLEINNDIQLWIDLKNLNSRWLFFLHYFCHSPPSPQSLFFTCFSLFFLFFSLSVSLSLSGLSSSLHDELMANKQTLAPVLGKRRGHRAAGPNSKVAI